MVNTDWIQHPWLLRHCQHLAAIRVRQQVHSCSDRPLLVLPMFGWTDLGDAVGKKSIPGDDVDLAEDQHRYLMPVRMQYDIGEAIAADQGIDTVDFIARGPGGFQAQSSLHVSAGRRYDDRIVTDDGQLVTDGITMVSSSLASSQLVDDGHTALWSLLTDIEYQLRSALQADHDRVRAEIYASTKHWYDQWVTDQDVDQIVSRLVHDPDQPLMRTVMAQVEDPHIFDKVDPVRHLHTKIRQVARGKIYDAIGDPSDGRGAIIRDAAAKLDCKDPDALPALMVGKQLTDVTYQRSTVVAALNPMPHTALPLDSTHYGDNRRGGASE